MNHEKSTIEDPSERPNLEPFATVFVEIIMSEAAIGGWFESGTTPPGKDLERISRRIGDQLKSQFGHAIHPAIWVHALLVCVHFF